MGTSGDDPEILAEELAAVKSHLNAGGAEGDGSAGGEADCRVGAEIRAPVPDAHEVVCPIFRQRGGVGTIEPAVEFGDGDGIGEAMEMLPSSLVLMCWR